MKAIVYMLLLLAVSCECKNKNYRQLPNNTPEVSEDNGQVPGKCINDYILNDRIQKKYSRGVNEEDSNQIAPLIEATKEGDIESLEMLLGHSQLDLNVRSKYYHKKDVTALMLASENGHKAMVEALLDKGAKVDAKNGWGQTALMLASENGHTAIMKILLDKGANVNAKNEYGHTALMCAVQNSNAAMVEALLGQGAKVDAKDGRGKKALMLAVRMQENQHSDASKQIIDLLRYYGGTETVAKPTKIGLYSL